MTACASCGATARRSIGPALLLVPVLIGAVAAAVIFATKGKFDSVFVIAGVTLAFGAFVAALIRFGLRLLRGTACPTCGATVEER